MRKMVKWWKGGRSRKGEVYREGREQVVINGMGRKRLSNRECNHCLCGRGKVGGESRQRETIGVGS